MRSRLATKKSAISALGGFERDEGFTRVALVRDAGEERYPREEQIRDFSTLPRWTLAPFFGHEPPDHLALIVGQHFAYADESARKWDAILDYALRPVVPERESARYPWYELDDNYQRYHAYWSKHVPAENQAMLKRIRFVHYDRVVAIDTDGDCESPGPHVLVEFNPLHGLFEPGEWLLVELDRCRNDTRFVVQDKHRVEFFQKPLHLDALGVPKS